MAALETTLMRHTLSFALAMLAACRGDTGRATPLSIDDPGAFWFSGEFVRVVGPIRPPSPDAEREQVEVWIAIDPEAQVGTVIRDDGSASLRFGSGTRADRIEWSGDGSERRIVDVRGTWFDEHGACSHHVLRPATEHPGSALVGMQWPCDDGAAAADGGEQMRARLATLPPYSRMTDARREAALDGIARQLDCDGCHREDRDDAVRIDEHGAVWRGTDASGFFAPRASLRDAVPLEGYGAFDLNVADPAIVVDCGVSSATKVEAPSGAARWRCGDGRVPLGRFDWHVAQATDPARAAEICAWRSWMVAHLDTAGQAAFAGAIAPCKKFSGDR
jgi:hypothetical protein